MIRPHRLFTICLSGLWAWAAQPIAAQPEEILCVRSSAFTEQAIAVEAFFQDAQGFLWLKTAQSDVRFDGNECRLFPPEKQFPAAGREIEVRHQRWHAEGSFLRNDKTAYPLPPTAGLPRALFLHEKVTGDSVLWVLADSALLCFDVLKNRFTRHFRHDPLDPQSLLPPPYRCAFLSREGILWVGGAQGFIKYDHRMQVLRFHDALPDTVSRFEATECFLASRHRPGQWMITAPPAGLVYYDPKRRKTTDTTLSQFAHMRGMAYDKKGRLIVSTRPVMLVMDEPSGRILHRLPPMQDMFDLTDIDSAGHYWHMCSDAGPYMLRNDIERLRLDTVRFDHFPDGQPGLLAGPWSWKPDLRGYCWLMTLNQVIRINTATLEKSRVFLDKLPGIRQLPQPFRGETLRGDTPDGKVWVRGQRELICFEFDRPEATLQIFPFPFVANTRPRIEVDDLGRPWSANEHGLFKFDPARKTYAFYDASDGYLRPGDRDILTKNVLGSLWTIAGRDGNFGVFDPIQMPEFQAAQPVVTDVWVNAQPQGIASGVGAENPLRLEAHENIVQFGFTAPDFRQGRHLTFRYRLLGADSSWILCDTSRSARFFNLTPGAYTFVVQAANREGDWNPEAARFRFVIAAPFYRKAWFLAVCLLVSAGLVFGVRRLVGNLRRRRDAALRSGIAAELQQEISGLLNSIEQLRSQQESLLEQGEASSMHLLGNLDARIRSAQAALADMVWAINPENDPMPEVLARMQAFAEGPNLPSVVFETGPGVADRSLPIERRREFFKIFQSCLLLCADEGVPQVQVRLEIDGKRLRLRIASEPVGGAFLKNADMEPMKKLASRIGASLHLRPLEAGGAEMVLEV